MRKKRILSMSLILACILMLTGCEKQPAGQEAAVHEPITIQTAFRNMSAFLDQVNAKYPEINLQVQPYSGQNYTAYVLAQMKAGDMPDIYFTTYYNPSRDQAGDKLMDLSGYAFTNLYSEARLSEVADNGAVYMLPTYYNCLGITYNKTLLERHGWTLPRSLKDLEELAPKVAAAGCNLALAQTQLPGYGFQYLCNILDTDFLNTPEGRKWQNAYLDGSANVSDTPAMMASLKTLEKWRDLGMLNGDADPDSDNATRLMMAQGNTLFLLGTSNVFGKEETTDEFGLMPYLSEDGTRNAFILNVSRYVGLNKHLQDPGNEQKLEDALHVMEVLSSVEGMQALNSAYSNTALLPLKDYHVNPEGYYADIQDQLNMGITAPFIYGGWENVIVPVGEVMIRFIRGEAALQEVANALDSSQHLILDNQESTVTTVAEKLDTSACARMVGICFGKASGADLALISKNKWYKRDYNQDLNLEGVSGELLAMPITDQELVSILPTGWRGNIQTVTLTGKRIQELARLGYDRNDDGNTFPYELVTPQNMQIQPDQTYTVAVCGVTGAVAREGNLRDTGILGLDAMRQYAGQFETLSQKDLIWE